MNNCILSKKEFYFGEDVYIVLSLTPKCAKLRKKNSEDVLEIFSNNLFFKRLIDELAGRGILAMDI